jgi:hypothetical protein
MKARDNSGQIYSYIALRNTIGWIGILLPFVMMLGGFLIFGENITLCNISMYYYTGMRDVYVGAMCAVGLFLFFYRGYDKWDDWAGNIAGFCAFCIAWFPTTKIGPQNLAGNIHFYAAAIFFLVLACFSLLLFTRQGENPTKQKLKRNKIYICCGLVMLVCIIAVRIYFSFLKEIYPFSPFVFWNETVALVAFGISWLTKGGTFYPDKKRTL